MASTMSAINDLIANITLSTSQQQLMGSDDDVAAALAGHLMHPTLTGSSSLAAIQNPIFNGTSSTIDDGRRDIVEPHLAQIIMYPRGATLFAAVCCVLFIVVGTLGNLITILALWKCKKLRNNATTSFVMSLCIADLIFCSVNMPLTVSRYIHEAWIFGDTLCTLFPLFFYGNVGVSLMSMTAITINRYILIAHHQRYDRIYKRRNIVLMIAFVWAFSFAILVPTLVKSWGHFGYSAETFSCTILKLDGKSPKKFLFLFGFLLPCIVIVLSYSCIFYKVRQSRRNLAAHGIVSKDIANNMTNSSSSKKFAEDIRLTRLMLIIFVSFIVCFLPLMITNVFDDNFVYPAVHVVASVLAYASSCINPLIYAVLNRQYRHAYARVLCQSANRRRVRGQGLFTVILGGRGRRSPGGGGTTNSSSNCSSDRSKTVATEIYQYNAMTKQVQTAAASADRSDASDGSKPFMEE